VTGEKKVLVPVDDAYDISSRGFADTIPPGQDTSVPPLMTNPGPELPHPKFRKSRGKGIAEMMRGLQEGA
jgi:hypothetical protein